MNDDSFFWKGVDEGMLLAQQCRQCGVIRHPPSPMCGKCQSSQWDVRQLSGRGRIFSWLISKHPTQADIEPRTVVLVDLEEGFRLVSNLHGTESPEIGQEVSVFFADVKGVRLPQFTATNSAHCS